MYNDEIGNVNLRSIGGNSIKQRSLQYSCITIAGYFTTLRKETLLLESPRHCNSLLTLDCLHQQSFLSMAFYDPDYIL